MSRLAKHLEDIVHLKCTSAVRDDEGKEKITTNLGSLNVDYELTDARFYQTCLRQVGEVKSQTYTDVAAAQLTRLLILVMLYSTRVLIFVSRDLPITFTMLIA